VGTYLLWDIDGTLIENDFTIVSVYAQAFELTVGTAPTAQIENPHGMTEAQLLREMLRIHGHDVSLHDTLIGHLDVVAARRHEEGVVRRPCAGVEAALTRFAELGWHNALRTGNAPDRARYKVREAGLDDGLFDWEHSFFGHRSETRHHLTAMARDALADDTAIIIGDTPMDGLAAASAGFPFLAVGTGAYTADELGESDAFLAIDSFATGLEPAIAAIRALEAATAAVR